MNRDIADRILRSSELVVTMTAEDKLLKYLKLLASTGKTEEQLLQLGSAYLNETLKPDPRYSGC